nr:transposase [Clostridium estertheticum]
MHKRWDIENNAFHQLKTEWHLDHCFLHGPTGVETVLMFIIIAFNLMQLYFFKCIRSFTKKRMLQIDIIEDIRDEYMEVQLMVKKKSTINLALILSLCLNFMLTFNNRPKAAMFSILYDIVCLVILVVAVLSFYVQIKEGKRIKLEK